MATEEELRIILRSVADTSGAERMRRSLVGVQAAGRNTGGAAGGIGDIGATASVAATQVGGLRAGLAAFTTLTPAIAGAAGAFGTLGYAAAQGLSVFRESERLSRVVSAAYGQQSRSVEQFASSLSASAGVSRNAVLESAVSARTLVQNYGLSIEQSQRLIAVTADLAAARGIGLFEAFERVQSAIRGEAEASEYLGLTLNETFLKTRGLTEAMSEQQKAQIRLNELLRQSAQFSGLAAGGATTLAGAEARATAATEEMGREFGATLAPAALRAQQAIGFLAQGTTSFIRFLRDGTLAVNEHTNALDKNTLAKIDNQRLDQQGKPGPNDQAFVQSLSDAVKARLGIGAKASGGGVAIPFVPTVPSDLWEERRREIEDQLKPVRVRLEGIDIAEQRALLPLQQQLRNAEAAMIQPRQQLANLQERINALLREDLGLTLQLLRAQQASLPSSRRVEDLDFQRQRLTLQIAAERNARREGGTLGFDIAGNRQQLRALGRQLPAAQLAALEGGRGVTLAQRAQQDANLAGQISAIPLQQQAQALQGVVDRHQAALVTIQQQITGIGLLADGYRDRLLPAVLDAQEALLDLERKRQELLNGPTSSNAPGSGAGLRGLREGGEPEGGRFINLPGSDPTRPQRVFDPSRGPVNGTTLAPVSISSLTINVQVESLEDARGGSLRAFAQSLAESIRKHDGLVPNTLPGNLD